MFAVTDKGIWRSDDDGQNWSEKTEGLPWKQIQGFAGSSDPTKKSSCFTAPSAARTKTGSSEAAFTLAGSRRDLGISDGAGLNTETRKADEWAYGSISQYRQLLTTDAKPLTVYAFNTSTGFHPPHSDTVYRSDDGGEACRATYFQDPRFPELQCVARIGKLPSCGKSFKGGETPFGVAICNTDPNRVILVRNEPHITHDGGRTWVRRTHVPGARPEAWPRSAWVCNGLVVTTTWHFYTDHSKRTGSTSATRTSASPAQPRGQSWIWWEVPMSV